MLFHYSEDPAITIFHPQVAPTDPETGYWGTAETVVPFGCEPVGDLLAKHAAAGIELRVTPSLWPLRDALVASTVRFSMSRLRNAAPRSESRG